MKRPTPNQNSEISYKPSRTVELDPILINEVLIAVRQAADLLCDRWTLLVLLMLLTDCRRYSQIKSRLNISTRALNNRLALLEDHKLIQRVQYMSKPPRYEYVLLDAGKDCFKIFQSFVTWENEWRISESAAKEGLVVSIVHKVCGTNISAQKPECTKCHASVYSANQISLDTKVKKKSDIPYKKSQYRRTTQRGLQSQEASVYPLYDTTQIFGDKWTIEIVVCAFMGISTFSGFQSATGIATNILSDRLRSLVSNRIFSLSGVQAESDREYLLTDRGLDLYATLVIIEAWADKWLSSRSQSPLVLIHNACETKLSLQVLCQSCGCQAEYENCSIQISNLLPKSI